MSSHYCSADWHFGDPVPADYIIRSLESTSSPTDPQQTYADVASAYHGPPVMFSVCGLHLASALRIMLKLTPNVRVREVKP